MPDSDKFSSFMEFGLLIGGLILGVFGVRRARTNAADDQDADRIRELEAERVDLRSDAMEARIIAKIDSTDARQSADRELGLKSNRNLFFETFEKYHNARDEENAQTRKKIDGIDDCVRRLEKELASMRGEIDGVKSRPTRR